MVQDQKSLTLRWRSFLGSGSDILAATLSPKGGQISDYSLISSHSCSIIQDEWTQIVDAPLTLIFKG